MLVPNWTLLDCAIAPPPPGVGPRWRALAARSLVPSGHHVPELMTTAFSHWPQARLALAEDSEALRLALPLVRRRLPVPVNENWSSPINFHALPHVDRDHAGPALTALLRKLRTPLFLRAIPTEGPLWEALAGSATRLEVVNGWQRAVLRPEGTYARWFESNFDRKRRNALRRMSVRLSEKGQVEARSLGQAAEAARWAQDFMTLEAAGWKGRQGTAMRCDAKTATAFPSACAALAEAGALRFWKLERYGKPVAMLFGYADGNCVWLGKIAHDEAHARCSPGVLLMLHATEQLFAEGVALADSCADAGHPMVDSLWRGRLPVADVMLAGPHVPGALFKAAVAAERARRKLRRAARAALGRLATQGS